MTSDVLHSVEVEVPVSTAYDRWSRSECSARATRSRETDDIVVRFVVWLARRDVPVNRRRRYRRHADGYLRWMFARGATALDGGGTLHYLAWLGRGGADAVVLGEARAALVLLERCLRPGAGSEDVDLAVSATG